VTARHDFEALRDGLDLAVIAEGEGLKVWRRSRGLAMMCPACGRGDRSGSGALSRDGVRWSCVRCEAKGDAIDIIRLCRRIDAAEAVRIARELAGLGAPSPSTGWSVPSVRSASSGPRILPSVPALDAVDVAERMRAVRLAALHYQYLAGLADGEDWPSPEEHVDFLAELGAFDARRVRIGDGRRRVPDLEVSIGAALAYLAERAWAALHDSRPLVAELVGICPAQDSGLRGWLRHHGGDALVEAGERAGLFLADGGEHFAGRLIYLWTDDIGRVVYLTGRAVPALVEVCGIQRNDKGEVIKGMALPSPDNNPRRIGVQPPDYPFGAAVARRLVAEGDAIELVEGELDAIHGLRAGPTVATGGTGRMGSERGAARLRAWLESLPSVTPIVSFDREADGGKQAEVDRRAMALARAVGGRVVPAKGADNGRAA